MLRWSFSFRESVKRVGGRCEPIRMEEGILAPEQTG